MAQGQRGETQKKFEKKFGRDALENCPVCGKEDHHSRIVRHLMSSRRDPSHRRFMIEQDDRILHLYDEMDVEDFSIYAIALAIDVFCSAAHVRHLLSRYRPDWKHKANQKRIIDTARQYEDGRRKKPTQFGNGSWKASKELGTGCYTSLDKRNAIVDAFCSDDHIKTIAQRIGCKDITVTKIWQEEFGSIACEKRLNRIWRFRKPSKEVEQQIIALFKSDKSAREIAKTFDTYSHNIANIWKGTYSKEVYERRALKMRKLGILKSLKLMGDMAVSGSRPEQACFEALSEICCTDVIHHDTETLTPYEIDITLPQWKIAVCWDGPMHRRPIFGQEKLARVMRRDADKRRMLLKMGWTIVAIADECKKFKHLDMPTVANAVMDAAAEGGLQTITVDERGRTRRIPSRKENWS